MIQREDMFFRHGDATYYVMWLFHVPGVYKFGPLWHWKCDSCNLGGRGRAKEAAVKRAVEHAVEHVDRGRLVCLVTDPGGCRFCGADEEGHGVRVNPTDGRDHCYLPPTSRQRDRREGEGSKVTYAAADNNLRGAIRTHLAKLVELHGDNPRLKR